MDVNDQIACTYAVLQDTAKAMTWLEHSAETGLPCWPLFRWDPHLESLGGSPAFEQFVAALERKFGALEIRRL